MTKIILLNGPPGSGKDTLGNHLSRWLDGAPVTYKFAEPLKRGVYVLYGLDYNLPLDYFEATKEEPSPLFNGLSFRQACIQFSEKQVKPFLGEEHFGEMFVRKIIRDNPKIAIVTDSGFISEVNPVVREFGHDNILLVRIHAEKRGKTFKGDSRSYISVPRVHTIDLYNDGKVIDFLANATDRIREEFLGHENTQTQKGPECDCACRSDRCSV